MNKKIFIISAILILAVSAGVVYFDRVILQKEAKAFIIEGIEKSTGKKCAIRSIKFNIFKGIVVKDFIISENNVAIINIKEAYASFLIQPFFKKQLIIPSIKLKSCEIFLERNKNGIVNLAELFSKTKFSDTKYNILIRRVKLSGASINFRDDALTSPVTGKMRDLNADIYVSLTGKMRFNFEFGLQDDALMKINVAGEYDNAKNELKLEGNIKDILPDRFKPYYSQSNFSLPEGRCDVGINLLLKESVIDAGMKIETRDLVFSKDNITAKVNSAIKCNLKFNLNDKKLSYSGNADVISLGLSGIETIDSINDVKGNFAFDDTGISSSDIAARVLNLPVKARFTLNDYSNPSVKVDISSIVDLADLQNILKDTFNIKLPANLEGQGKLYVALEYELPQTSSSHVGGFLEVENAKIALSKASAPLESVRGKFNFTDKQLRWDGLEFDYLKTQYSTSGMLTNFDTPGIQFKLSSKNLTLESVFGVNDKLITISKLSGTYFDSQFSINGSLDLSDEPSMEANLNGTLEVDLKDLKEFFKGFKDKQDKMKLSGIVHTEFNLKGDVKDLRSCDLDAKFSSASLSAYGLKPSGVFVNYKQGGGIAEIPFIHAALYGGTVDASAKINMMPKDIPYSVNAEIRGVKIEQLKADTPFKDKDIAGAIYTKLKLIGYSNNVDRLTGSGNVSISNGKLWQLNLFRGLGVLIFTSDFSNIMFKEGGCDFTIGKKEFFTDKLMLRSDLLDLYGPVTIDFQGGIKAELRADMKEEALGYGAKRNIKTAIGQYGIIDINGTLKEPKYNLKPDVGSIIEDIADRFMQR